MNYKTLLKLIQDMSPAQQEMDVVFATQEGNIIVSMVSEIVHNDNTHVNMAIDPEQMPVGQPILS